MEWLLPRFSPLQSAALLVLLVVCYFFGGPTPDDISLAIPPVLVAAMVTAAVAAPIIGGVIANRNAKRAEEDLAQSAAGRASTRQTKRASKRMKSGKYGKSLARQRKETEEVQRAYLSGTKQIEADIKSRAAANPLSAAGAQQDRQALTVGAVDVLAKGRSMAQEASDKLAASQQAADAAQIQRGYANEANRVHALAAGSAAQTQGIVSGIQSGASLGISAGGYGLFDKPPGGGGPGSKAPESL